VWNVSRRKFLELLGATGWFSTGGALVQATTPGQAAAPGYKVLSPAQVATLEAMAEQIIPADQDPSAREAGAVHYIDNVLASEQSERLALYAVGLEGTDQTSQLLYGLDFAKVSFDEQTVVLNSLEQGTAPGEVWRIVSSQEFFALAWGHVLEGFYGSPEHGGNKNYVSWEMVGFPEHSGTM
jgi:gluconate 2-dehydrogenase gamma chain